MDTREQVHHIQDTLHLNLEQIARIINLPRQPIFSSMLFNISMPQLDPLLELCLRLQGLDLKGKTTSIMIEQRTFLGWLNQTPFNIDKLVEVAVLLDKMPVPTKRKTQMTIHEQRRANIDTATVICKR